MVFSSLIFLFRFLPLTLFAYYTAPRKLRELVLFWQALFFMPGANQYMSC